MADHIVTDFFGETTLMTVPLVCFSHLRWNFVYQRPQHLMSRCRARTSVFFFEEPLYESEDGARLSVSRGESGVHILTPMLPSGTDAEQAAAMQQSLLRAFFRQQKIERFIAWYLTPMALRFTRQFKPELTVYDCMDELSAFWGAPPELVQLEQELFDRADAVFVGGRSLFEVKRKQHGNVHLFPSSIDREHFGTARAMVDDPVDQRQIPHPRIGFFGVLDERLDRELLSDLATDHPGWHFVLLGPVVKIAASDLPNLPNIHYLGQKPYLDLPRYLANWELAMLPFAMNASTRFISPTKTPEYLAAAKRVVSTPIRDVVEPYGRLGLVEIAASSEQFGKAIERSLNPPDETWSQKVDDLLSRTSWDSTFSGMWREILQQLEVKARDTGTRSEEAAIV